MKTLWLLQDSLGVIEKLNVNEDDSLTIDIKDQEPIIIEYYHSQGCCENVYADFSNIPYHENKIKGKKITKLEIKGVTDIGFLLCFYNNDGYTSERVSEKVLVPCYNEQNGYYSDELDLIVQRGNKKIRINLEGYIEDNIY